MGIRSTFSTPTIKIVIDTFFWETFLKLIFIIDHIRSLLEAPTRDTIRDARRNRHPGSPFLKLEFRVSNPNVQLRWCRSLVFRYHPTCLLCLFRSVLDRIGMGLLELSKKSQWRRSYRLVPTCTRNPPASNITYCSISICSI